MSKSKEKSERRVTAASYIISFYQEVQELTNRYSQYVNVMLELEVKTSQEAEAGDQEKMVLSQVLQLIRFHAHKCFIQYKSILPSLKIEENPQIEVLYKNVKTKFVINRDDIEELVILFNQVLIQGVIKDLLETSQDLVSSVYDDTATG